MNLALQFIGAIIILVPFALLLLGHMARQGAAYLWLNLIGSTLLAIDAWLQRQWGFIILQAVWALVAAWGLAQRLRGYRPPG
jgi:hypothetical protein